MSYCHRCNYFGNNPMHIMLMYTFNNKQYGSREYNSQRIYQRVSN